MNRNLIVICVVACLGLVVYSCRNTITYTDGEICEGKSTRLAEFINVHTSPHRFVSLSGKKFYDVSGGNRSYLRLSKTKRVLLVISPPGEYGGRYIICSTDGDNIHEFIAEDTVLAFGMGRDVPREGDWVTKVVSDEPSKAIVESIFEGKSMYFEFNLDTLTLKKYPKPTH